MRNLAPGTYADLRTGAMHTATPFHYCSNCHGPKIVQEVSGKNEAETRAIWGARLAKHNERVARTGERAYTMANRRAA